MNAKLILLFLCCPFLALSQNILKGNVKDLDQNALPDVSIYFDGTTIGTITDEDGDFSILMPRDRSIPLIISMLGFETLQVTNYANAKERITFNLKPSTEQLNPVMLEHDTWSREKKLAEFKKAFFGPTRMAEKCSILNEDALQLIYRPSKESLTAYAEEPLIIENDFLGYRVRYNLNAFKAEFETLPCVPQHLIKLYYEGSSFFQEINEPVKRKYINNRKRAYNGSLIHFLQTLESKTLYKNRFVIYDNKMEVAPYSKIEVAPHDDEYKKITFTSNELSVAYDGKYRTSILAENPFYVDKFGNHTPPRSLTLNGDMGNRRIAYLLPLNYIPTK